MPDPLVLVERDEGLAVVTLDRPDAMNALSAELRLQLTGAFEALQDEPDVRVVILTGAGRAFCAGLDLKELGRRSDDRGRQAINDGDILRAMAGFAGPIIGAINGVAITGGFELALACDVLVASTQARFADTHARVGILPGWGLSQKLSRAIGIYRAKEISLTGNFVSAQQACDWGLVNRVVEPHALLDTCRALARDMLSCVPEALSGYKRIIDEGFAATFAEGMRLENELSRAANRGVSAEAIAARRETIQKRGRRQTAG